MCQWIWLKKKIWVHSYDTYLHTFKHILFKASLWMFDLLTSFLAVSTLFLPSSCINLFDVRHYLKSSWLEHNTYLAWPSLKDNICCLSERTNIRANFVSLKYLLPICFSNWSFTSDLTLFLWSLKNIYCTSPHENNLHNHETGYIREGHIATEENKTKLSHFVQLVCTLLDCLPTFHFEK